jgi:hypothetical protein
LLNYAVFQYANFSDFKCDIPELNGYNYKIGKEKILLHLGWMDIDFAIRKDEAAGITETSEPDVVDLYEKWERSNHLSVMFIKPRYLLVSVVHSSNIKRSRILLKPLMSSLPHMIRPLLAL